MNCDAPAGTRTLNPSSEADSQHVVSTSELWLSRFYYPFPNRTCAFQRIRLSREAPC